MEEIKFKDLKKEHIKNKLKTKFNELTCWFDNNKEFALVIISAGSFLLKGGLKLLNKGKEKNLKELYCYDRSLGIYWKLRRPLKNSEMLEIHSRREQGESLGKILKSMKVLK